MFLSCFYPVSIMHYYSFKLLMSLPIITDLGRATGTVWQMDGPDRSQITGTGDHWTARLCSQTCTIIDSSWLAPLDLGTSYSSIRLNIRQISVKFCLFRFISHVSVLTTSSSQGRSDSMAKKKRGHACSHTKGQRRQLSRVTQLERGTNLKKASAV